MFLSVNIKNSFFCTKNADFGHKIFLRLVMIFYEGVSF